MTPQKGDRVWCWNYNQFGRNIGTYLGEKYKGYKVRHSDGHTRIYQYVESYPREPKLKPFPVKHNGKAIMVYRATEVDEILNQE